MNLGIEIIGICLLVFGLLVVQFSYYQKKNRRELTEQLKRGWGKYSEKTYDANGWERISHYDRNHQSKPGRIDEITWNDLDMDSVFRQMNRTESAIGEEYLYTLLHNPVQEGELRNREILIRKFAEDESLRIQLQLMYHSIGSGGQTSISDYLVKLEQIPQIAIGKHVLSLAGTVASIVLLLLFPIIGIFALIVALCFSLMVYYREKARISDYMNCFKQISAMLYAAKQFESIETEELRPYIEKIRQTRKSLDAFQKMAVFLPGGAVSGSPMDILLDYVRMLTHIDMLLFQKMEILFKDKKEDIEVCLEQFGFIESMIAVASYRQALPEYCLPEISVEKSAFSKEIISAEKPLSEKRVLIEDLYHPCIHKAVRNSIVTDKSVLLTGSNASGKSTFLKSVAIAALLAQTVHTVPAKRYQAPFYQIYSSMALKDNLAAHESYYMVEIKSLKRILDVARKEIPVLCFIDEVLRGTNTVERIAASTEILKGLDEKNVLCFAATHDIELTELLKKEYENYHFSERMKEKDISFDYTLKKGPATSRNAIRLISQLGYEEKIVSRAITRADEFVKTGKWT